MLRIALSGTAVAFALLACGSSDSGSKALSSTATPATGADANNYCSAFCGWQKRCNLTPTEIDAGPSTCQSGCLAAAQPREAATRASFFENVTTCFTKLDCNHEASACADDFALGDPTFPNIKEVQDCLTKYETCGGVFSDEKCDSISTLTQAHRSAAEACLSSTDCTTIDKCLTTAGAYDVQE